MPASSLIFLVIIALWAAYLVPNAIRRHRRTASARQEDRESEAMRAVVRGGSAVLAPALPAPSPAVAAIGTSSRPVLNVGPTSVALQSSTRHVAQKSLHRNDSERPATQVVARRRRLVVTVLALAVVGWGFVAAGLVPWWAGAVPTAGLLLVVAALSRHGAAAPARAVRFAAAAATPTSGATVVRPARPVVAASVPAPRHEQSVAAAGLRDWQPVAVPLPTYLLKDKARHVAAASAGVPAEVPVVGDRPAEVVIDLRDHAQVVNG